MNKTSEIMNYLDYLIPEPKCALNYKKDYELLISIMLSAQTTDKRVNEVTKVMYNKYPSLKALKGANLKDIENIIRSLGSYTKKAKAVLIIAKMLDEEYNGIVPTKRDILESFPMVGRKTTNVFLSEYYNIPNIAVDTHVERVSKRLGLAKKTDSVLQIESKLKKKFPKDKWCRLHLQMVLFGRHYCMARNPKCDTCKIKDLCKEKRA